MLKNWKNINVSEDQYGRQLETKNISDDLNITIIMLNNNRKKMIKVDFMDSKFTMSRTFMNNYDGNIELQDFIDSVDSEDKVKKYLGLK